MLARRVGGWRWRQRLTVKHGQLNAWRAVVLLQRRPALDQRGWTSRQAGGRAEPTWEGARGVLEHSHEAAVQQRDHGQAHHCGAGRGASNLITSGESWQGRATYQVPADPWAGAALQGRERWLSRQLALPLLPQAGSRSAHQLRPPQPAKLGRRGSGKTHFIKSSSRPGGKRPHTCDVPQPAARQGGGDTNELILTRVLCMRSAPPPPPHPPRL